jgi:hypothetical protein
MEPEQGRKRACPDAKGVATGFHHFGGTKPKSLIVANATTADRMSRKPPFMQNCNQAGRENRSLPDWIG